MSLDLHPRSVLRTHTVENQPRPLDAYNAFTSDLAMREAVEREGAGWAREELIALGGAVGDPANVEQARLANLHSPTLRRFDAAGRRVDVVEFHPAWHDIMGLAWRHELPTAPWRRPRSGSHVAKAAKSILFNELEGGCMCPVAITYGSVPLLRHQPELAALWEPLLLSERYDGRPLPAGMKTGVTAAFAATEKQGGSDLRGNATRAVPVAGAGPGREYLLHGHKWFVSSAGADLIIVSARTDKGISLFAVPRWLPDGSRNAIVIERIKDKMGNCSNPSVEMEFDGTHGWMIGEDGRGIANAMVFMQYSRFEVALMPVGEMRLALVQALHHARERSAFGRPLVELPLMKNVLADLTLEYEASVMLALRIGRAQDEGPANELQRAFGRLSVAIAKYWHSKRAVGFTQECMEVLGASGYVEESILPRFFREAPVNNIWEGSGNVICLDILRTVRNEPAAMEALFSELALAKGGDRRLDAQVQSMHALLSGGAVDERLARRVAERLAMCLQASLLVRHAAPWMADAFCASRFEAERSGLFGTLDSQAPLDALVARTTPDMLG
ncbi:acyl-CoA dehydrogenase family protein [Variovorax paradoxus]|nr:acyl-CoA dehydrogenase family protein [Variovorax paradoxus]MBT2301902.1 acyl-CoA dehydrogenase family protein [Variovorax paradoxus]